MAYAEGIAHFERLFDVRPRVVAHDLHPDYASTAYALEREGVRTVGVQHHHAHLAACLAEHGSTGPAVGAIYDGSGYGLDGTVWGGEILVGDLRGMERAGHLLPVRLPGGDRAARQPWRMAAAWLQAAGAARALPPESLRRAVPHEQWETVCEMARRGFSAPWTTSAGRLLDAVSALCGIRASCTYEGQAAIELEALADVTDDGAYELPVGDDLVIDPRPAIRAVLGDVDAGVPAGAVSARMHRALARATAAACAASRRAGRAAPRRAQRRRLPEPAAARVDDRRLRRARASTCWSRAPCRRTTAASRSARPPSRSPGARDATHPIRPPRR